MAEWKIVGDEPTTTGYSPDRDYQAPHLGRIDPNLQRQRDAFGQRLDTNASAVEAGQPSSLGPRIDQLIPTSRAAERIGPKKEWTIVEDAPAEKKPFSWGKELVGLSAGVADAVAGAISLPISGLVGLGATAFGGAKSGADAVEKTSELLTPSRAAQKMGVPEDYLGQTGTHQLMMKILGAPHEYISVPIADKYFELTGRPLGAAIVQGALDIPAYLLAFKGAKSVASAGARPKPVDALRQEAGYKPGGESAMDMIRDNPWKQVDPKVIRPDLGQQSEFPFPQEYVGGRQGGILNPQRIAELEAELNPPTERRAIGQGELFTEERPYSRSPEMETFRSPDQATDLYRAPDLPIQNKLPTRPPYDVLPEDVRAKLEAELNPAIERQVEGQGELFPNPNSLPWTGPGSRQRGAIGEPREVTLERARQAMQGRGRSQAGMFVPASLDHPTTRAAKDMLDRGIGREEVWKRTGIMQGPDGKFRREISDHRAELDGNLPRNQYDSRLVNVPMFQEKTLGDTLSHPDVYRKYPHHKDTPVKSTGFNFDIAGGYDKGKISLAGGKPSEVLQTALHELQHKIQDESGFARGGNTGEFLAPEFKAVKDRITKAERELRKKLELEVKDIIPKDQGGHLNPYVLKALEENPQAKNWYPEGQTQVWNALKDNPYYKEWMNLHDQATVLTKMEAQAYQKYKRLAGEAEARNVEARQKLTPEERRQIPPWKTLDVPESEMIVRTGPPVGPGRKQGGWIGDVDRNVKKQGLTKAILEERKQYSVETRSAAEVAKEMQEQGTKDISPNIAFVSNTAIPKQLAYLSQDPLIKWGVDKTNEIARRETENIKYAMEGEEYTTGKKGWEKRIPSMEVGIQPFRKMFNAGKKDRALLSEMKDIWLENQGKEPLTRESFKTDKQWQAYSALARGLDKMHQDINTARARASEEGRPGDRVPLKPIPKLENYFPAVREGDYRVYVKDADGNTVKMTAMNNRWVAEHIQKEFEKKNPGAKVYIESVGTKDRYQMSDVSALAEAADIMAREGNNKLAAEFNRVAADIMSHRGAGRHGLFKKGVAGFLGEKKGEIGLRDLETAYESYANQVYRYIGNLEKSSLQAELRALDPKFQNAHPNSLKYLNDYLDINRGKKNSDWIRDAVGAFTERAGFGQNAPYRMTQGLSFFILPYYLLTARNAIANMSQVTSNLAALSKLQATGEATHGASRSFVEGLSNVIHPDSTALKAGNWAMRQGYIDPTITQMMAMDLSQSPLAMTRKIEALLKWVPSKIEQNFVRFPSFLMYEKALRDTVKDDQARFKQAAEIMDDRMVNYNRHNTPLMYEKAGLVGDLAKPLKQFAHNTWGALFDYATFAKDTGKMKPVAWHLANTTMMSGLKGAPIVAEVTAAIALWNILATDDIPSPEKMMYESKLPDALVRGGLSTVLRYDVSSSVSHPGLPQMVDFPVIGIIEGWIDAANYIAKRFYHNTATEGDEMKALLGMSPNMFKGTIEEAYTKEGRGVPNPNNNMEWVYQRDKVDKVMSVLGSLRHVDEAKARAIISAAKKLRALDEKQKIEAIDAIVDRIDNGKEITPELIQKYIEEGGDPQRLPRLLKQRMEERMLTPMEQLMRRGVTPGKLHKLDRMKELNDIPLRENERQGVPQSAPGKGQGAKPEKTKEWTILGEADVGVQQAGTQGTTVVTPRTPYGMPIGRVGSPGTHDSMPNADENARPLRWVKRNGKWQHAPESYKEM